MVASLAVIIVKKKNVSGFTSLTFLVWQIAGLFRMKKTGALVLSISSASTFLGWTTLDCSTEIELTKEL